MKNRKTEKSKDKEVKKTIFGLLYLLIFSFFWLIIWILGIWNNLYTIPYLLSGILSLLVLSLTVYCLKRKPKRVVKIILVLISIMGFWDTFLGYRASLVIHKYDKSVKIVNQSPGEYQLNYLVKDEENNLYVYTLKDWEVLSEGKITE